jgi:hypothetical protein
MARVQRPQAERIAAQKVSFLAQAIGVAAAIAGLAAGIAIPVFYEIQVKQAVSFL